MTLLFRLILPVIRKINPRLWTCWAEMGHVTISRVLVYIMAKAKPFMGPKITPLS
jgi:hypothetical protein